MALDNTNSLVGRHQVDGEVLQQVVLPVGPNIAAGTPVAVGNAVGVTLEPSDASGNAVCDVRRKRWKYDVKNVTAYSSGAESTHKAVEVGDVVYIDPDTNELTLSPKNADGDDNVAFGTVYPKVYNVGDASTAYSGTATAVTEEDVVILVGDYRA